MAFERISLNIIPDGEMPVFHASQFDAGRPIIIDLYNGDDAYTPAAGVTFELHCRKVDDNIVTLDTYEVDGNTITFASTEQLCACSGDNLCEVAIMLDELLMGTLNFILHVERDPIAGGLTSETSIYNLQQQIDDIISGEGYVKDTDLEVLQSDWNETDVSSPAYIKNKPGPSIYEQADWTENDPLAQSYIKHKPDLKVVATSGSYNDLTDKPTIPAAQVNSDWNASSGVAEILNKPTIPTKTSELTNDSGFVESSELAAVATSGDYEDLLNKPAIPAAQVQSDWNQTNTGAVDYIKNKPILPFESKGQYLFKTTPVTKRSIEFTTLIGGTCGVNQMVDTGDTSVNTISGHKYLTRINHVESIIVGGSAVSINDSSEDNIIDLTAYFNPTIADYVYTLESGTSGAGITWLKNNGFFGADYYPYNAGGLLSVKTSKKINRDINNVIIGEYPLDDIELRGILKLDGNNNLYYDGDTYESNGSVTRKYGIVDLGTLNDWFYWSDQQCFVASLNDKKYGTKNLICANYVTLQSGSYESLSNYEIVGNDGNSAIYLKDLNYTDAATFKTAMSGKYLVYELATPTTETADPFTNPMIVDGNGTEEFFDGRMVEMPVGHDTFYIPMN